MRNTQLNKKLNAIIWLLGCYTFGILAIINVYFNEKIIALIFSVLMMFYGLMAINDIIESRK